MTATGGHADRDHRRHRGEGHALQQRQPDADLPEADRLDDRGDAAGEEVGVDQVDELLGAQVDGGGQQDRHDHRAGVERQDVLEAVDGELADRENLVDGMLHGSRRERPVLCGHGTPSVREGLTVMGRRQRL
jgi:hypothetical protein